MLSALHGTGSYAGTSSEGGVLSADGKAFLEQELDELMAAKARYKEIKLARMQLQRDLPAQAIDSQIARVDAEVREVLGAIQGSSSSSQRRAESRGALEEQLDGLMDEKAKYKEKKLSVVHTRKECEEKGVQHQHRPPSLAGTIYTEKVMWIIHITHDGCGGRHVVFGSIRACVAVSSSLCPKQTGTPQQQSSAVSPANHPGRNMAFPIYTYIDSICSQKPVVLKNRGRFFCNVFRGSSQQRNACKAAHPLLISWLFLSVQTAPGF